MDFPVADFITLYPVFSCVPDSEIELVAEQAECYLNNCGGKCYTQLWMLLVAHMLKLRQIEESGETAGIITSASIDKVSVSYATPPAGSDSAYWFGLTPYGKQYMVLNKRCGGVGFYVGDMPERSAFRSVGGRFSRGGRSR